MRAFDRLTIAWKLAAVVGLTVGAPLAVAAAALSSHVGGAAGLTLLQLAGAAVVALGVLIVLLAVGSVVVRNPLSGLTRSVETLRAGHYDRPVAGVAGGDEIGVLARALDGVRHDLAEDQRSRVAQEAERLAAEAKLCRQIEAARADADAQAATAAALGDGLERLAGGDLIWRMNEERFAPDARQGAHDFNAAVDRLQAALTGVLATARGLRGGVAELGEAAQALSHRTERQGVGLAQAAATLGRVNDTVRRSTQGAERARQVTHSAKANTETSGQVVREAISAMGGIERSSREITQIIGVIDEIAFQTNLLALNAGVEAARAGEAGRGFAVVAQEVRALAQRSADAAKQIKGLISTSTSQVDKGVKLVGRTGETLDQILAQVAELDGLVDEIAASAQDQTAGLAQLTVTIDRLEQGNRRTADMAELSAAAGQALADDAAELERLVGGFQVTAEVREYRPRPAPAAPQRDVFRQRYVQGATALKVEPDSRPGR